MGLGSLCGPVKLGKPFLYGPAFMHRGTVMVENRKRTHTQAVATKLEPHFFGLFIVQHPSESCYYGNQPGPCPAEVLVTFNRRKTHNER